MSRPQPYYSDADVTLYCGDMREVLPALRQSYDLILTDPPYGETSLSWDRWPDGWVGYAADVTSAMWCFGSMRMLQRHGAELDRYWNFSQDVVWEKQNGSGFASDRFRRVHEHATHWYRGAWNWAYHQVPRVPAERETGGRWRTRGQPAQTGAIDAGDYVSDGTRMVRSVIRAATPCDRIHPTEKPAGILRPLIEYGCPPGGLVLDPFAGSCSTGVAARLLGRRAVLIEADEAMCAKAVHRRLAQGVLPLGVAP